MRDDIVDKFLRLPYQRRKRILPGGSIRLRVSKKKTEWTEDQVSDYIITNRVLSLSKLRALRQTDEECPPWSVVNHFFGSWSGAKKLFFPELFEEGRIQTPEQVVEMVARVSVRTWNDYREQRRVNPSIFPSGRTVFKWFGSWHNLKRLACARQLTNVITRYIILKRQLGRWPSNKECKDAGVEIDTMLKHFKDRSAMREMVVLLEKSNANRI